MKKIKLKISKVLFLSIDHTDAGRVFMFTFPEESHYNNCVVVFSERMYSFEETEEAWIVRCAKNNLVNVYDKNVGVTGDEPRHDKLENIKKEIELL